MRQAMKTPDMNYQYGVVEGCAVLMLDEVHSGLVRHGTHLS